MGCVPYIQYVINEGSRGMGDTRWLSNRGNFICG